MRIADFKHSQYFSPMLCHTIYRVVIFSLFKQEYPASIQPENWRPSLPLSLNILKPEYSPHLERIQDAGIYLV